MDMQLQGRTALVTGASVGIGRGIAMALAAEGVRVAVSARRADKLEELAAQIVAAGGAAPLLIVQDMLAPDAAQRIAAATLAGLGAVDILVNNAGGSRAFKELHVIETAWDEAITLNFHRPRQLADALVDSMIARRWGRMINITGKSEPDHVNGAFCAKAGMHSWAKGLRHPRAGRHAARGGAAAAGRVFEGAEVQRRDGAFCQRQCGGRRRAAGGIRGVHRRAAEDVERDRLARRHQAGLSRRQCAPRFTAAVPGATVWRRRAADRG